MSERLPTPPDGWPVEPRHQAEEYDRSRPIVHVHQYGPQRRGPSAGTVLAAGLGGGALLLTAAVSAIAIAVCAVSIAVCALVCRWIIADIRKDRSS